MPRTMSVAEKRKRLKELIQNADLSLSELSRRTKTPYSTVCHWVGDSGNPPYVAIAYLELYIKAKNLLS